MASVSIETRLFAAVTLNTSSCPLTWVLGMWTFFPPSPPCSYDKMVCAAISRIHTYIYMNSKTLSSSSCGVELTVATSDKSFPSYL